MTHVFFGCKSEALSTWLLLPLKDCTLHVVGLRQTMQLEGLTRGFDLTAEDNLAKASVAKTCWLATGRYPSSSTGYGYYVIASFTPANPGSLGGFGSPFWPILGDGFLWTPSKISFSWLPVCPSRWLPMPLSFHLVLSASAWWVATWDGAWLPPLALWRWSSAWAPTIRRWARQRWACPVCPATRRSCRRTWGNIGKRGKWRGANGGYCSWVSWLFWKSPFLREKNTSCMVFSRCFHGLYIPCPGVQCPGRKQPLRERHRQPLSRGRGLGGGGGAADDHHHHHHQQQRWHVRGWVSGADEMVDLDGMNGWGLQSGKSGVKIEWRDRKRWENPSEIQAQGWNMMKPMSQVMYNQNIYYTFLQRDIAANSPTEVIERWWADYKRRWFWAGPSVILKHSECKTLVD